MTRLLLALAVLAGCTDEAPVHAPAGPLAPTEDPRIPVLQGAIYYLEEQDHPVVVEIKNGVRTVIAYADERVGRRTGKIGSPDGTAIAFVDTRAGEQRIYLTRADGSDERRLTDRAGTARRETQPAWSPDGKLIAYVVERGARTHVWIRDVASGLEHDITPEGIFDLDPSFSPDGRWIVVSRTQGHDIDLWAVPTIVGEPVRITHGQYPDRFPSWR